MRNIPPINANKIILLDNKMNKIAEFTHSDDEIIDYTKWLELPLDKTITSKDLTSFQMKSLGSQAFDGIIQIGAIKSMIPNGLYTSTVNPGTLMHYRDGTIASIIQGEGGITGHAGFQSAGGAVFAPIIIFQVMSIVSGQYYLHGINKQLTSIDNKLNQLISLHEIERNAKIKMCSKILKELSKRRAANIEDVIHEEYAEVLDRIDIKRISDSDDRFWTKSKIEELLRMTSDANLERSLCLTILTDELLHLSKIIELYLNTGLNDNNNSRLLRICELIDEIKQWNENEFYFNKTGNEKMENYYSEVIRTAKRIYYDAWLYSSTAYEVVEAFTDKQKELSSSLNEANKSELLLQLSRRLIDSLDNPQKVLLYCEDNKIQKLLVEKVG